jgi:hypothetical protein
MLRPPARPRSGEGKLMRKRFLLWEAFGADCFGWSACHISSSAAFSSCGINDRTRGASCVREFVADGGLDELFVRFHRHVTNV